MKTAGAIYRKLKDIKFRHLILEYRKYLKRTPSNCKYNYPYLLYASDGQTYPIKLCLLHQDNFRITRNQQLGGVIPHLLDICQAQSDCQDCNAFICKHTKDSIQKNMERELSTKAIREKKYPEICALEWALERSFTKLPPLEPLRLVWISICFFFKGICAKIGLV